MMRVIVVDGYGYLAEGIRRHLELVPEQGRASELKVEGVVTGEEAIRAGRVSTPALIFVDLALPHESGFGLIRRLRTEFLETRLIACSMYDQGWLVARALASGGHGYIVKSAGHREFWRVVRVVLAGGLGIPDSVRSRWSVDGSRQVGSSIVKPGGVSVDDLRVVFGIVQGATSAELAVQWGCQESEVVHRRGDLQARLGCRTAEEWCRWALANGLMSDVWDESPRSGSA